MVTLYIFWIDSNCSIYTLDKFIIENGKDKAYQIVCKNMAENYLCQHNTIIGWSPETTDNKLEIKILEYIKNYGKDN